MPKLVALRYEPALGPNLLFFKTYSSHLTNLLRLITGTLYFNASTEIELKHLILHLHF